MTIYSTVFIALGLAMDAFAVSLASGLVIERLTVRHIFRCAFHFGLFQAGMPVLGWWLGGTVAHRIEAYAPWIAFLLLAAIGGKMLREAWAEAGQSNTCADPTRGWSLVALSVATSIDALAVGLSLAMLQVTVWTPAAIIGVITAALSATGMVLGHRLGCRWGRWAQTLGGVVLIGIGLRIVADQVA